MYEIKRSHQGHVGGLNSIKKMTLSTALHAINKIEYENSENYVTSLTPVNRSEFVKEDQRADNVATK